MISTKISRRYAKALLSLGQEDGQYEGYGRHLQEFNNFCSANSEFFQVISNQLFSVEDRMHIIEAALEQSSFDLMVKNFLKLLLVKNRIGEIQQITDYYSKLTEDISNITRVKVFTARPLTKKTEDKLAAALAGLVSKKVVIEVAEDKSLMGGLVVKIGDLVLDGSVSTQLQRLKESLKRGEYS